MNSCLYRCEVNHHRLLPKEHKFVYDIFMFYLDLDEISSLSSRLRLFSADRFNWFNFRTKDHMAGSSITNENLRQKVAAYLLQHNIVFESGKIMLLTNVATWGYAFNPISFYLCFDDNGLSVC